MTEWDSTGKAIIMNIRVAIDSVISCGMRPKRIYMNQITRDRLYYCYMMDKILNVTLISADKTEKVYGVPIKICNELENWEIDISCEP